MQRKVDLLDVVVPYLAALRDLGMELQSEEQRHFIKEIIKQHERFCDCYGFDADLADYDECQIVAWAPYLLASDVETSPSQRKEMLGVSISCLQVFVGRRGNEVSEYWALKVWEMGYHGYRVPNQQSTELEPVSIGKNGLYSSFMTAAETGLSPAQKAKNLTVRLIISAIFSSPIF